MQMTLSLLSSSRYHHPYAAELDEWSVRLSTVRDTLEPALSVQSTLLYLDNVFTTVKSSGEASSDDEGVQVSKPRAQLPEESAVFASVCKLWSRLMTRIEANPGVVHVCVVDTALGHSLGFLETQLDKCKRALTGYLAQKRHNFPRFYFLSDTALLEVLALSTGVQSLKRHLSNMFDSVTEVAVHPKNRSKIIGFLALGSHRLVFDPKCFVNTRTHVEDWMQSLLECSRTSIQLQLINRFPDVSTAATTGKSLLSVLGDVHSDTSGGIAGALHNIPPQIIIVLYRMLWTLLCETALQQWVAGDKSALHRLRLHYTRGFRELIDWMALFRSDSSITKDVVSSLESLITQESHHCDVVSSLSTIASPSACDAFDWKRYMRCYPTTKAEVVGAKAASNTSAAADDTHRFPWPSDMTSSPVTAHCRMEVLDVPLDYSYEYVGGHSVLVITPLTNRCQITIANAARHGFGVAPLGPAGTGKTETVKDVGRALGRFVVVTACSEETGPETLSRLYTGAFRTGAWLDLDEFNRLRPDVLSVAAAQVASILAGIRQAAPFFTFADGATHALRYREVGLFITMNPDYAGR